MIHTIGFDTSNYTTSIARFDGQDGVNCSRLLSVQQGQLGLRQSDALFAHIKSLPELSGRLFSDMDAGSIAGVNCSRLLSVQQGQLGLRQSDALFAHIKSLPELSGRLFSDMDAGSIAAVGVSTRPRAVEGSYMPCFLAGISQAALLSEALHVPLFEVSHQQGHIAAALWSVGRMELMDRPHLAWHLSGGTTELLLVEPHEKNVTATKIGGTTDISAGQLIDRTGQLLLGVASVRGNHRAASGGTPREECHRHQDRRNDGYLRRSVDRPHRAAFGCFLPFGQGIGSAQPNGPG